MEREPLLYDSTVPGRVKLLMEDVTRLAEESEELISALLMNGEPVASANMEMVLMALRETSLVASTVVVALPSDAAVLKGPGKPWLRGPDSCSVCGDDTGLISQGLCRKHYRRNLKHGSPYLHKVRVGGGPWELRDEREEAKWADSDTHSSQ